MTAKLRVGIVGCGYWGSKHVRVFSQLPTVEVVLIDLDEHRRNSLAQTFPVGGSYATLDEALPFVDAVVIATRPTSHHPLAAKALRAGRHVLVEKPLATSVEDALELVSLAAEHDCVCMTGHTFEYNPAVWKLREIVHSPAFGDVLYIDAARLNLGLYQPDVNVLWDLAPHDVSIINFLLRRQPTEVAAWGSRHADVHEDVGYLQLRYDESSLTANIHVSWLDPCKVRRITVVGTNQMVVYDDVNADERIRVYDKGVEPAPDPGASPLHEQPLSYRNGAITSPFVEFREPLQIEAEHFVECIRTGAAPSSDGWSGLDVVRVLVAADEALATGGKVTIPHLASGPVARTASATRASAAEASADRVTTTVAGVLHHLALPEQPVDLELVGTHPGEIATALQRGLGAAGFQLTHSDADTIAFARADQAVVSLRRRPGLPHAGVAELRLDSRGFPVAAALECIVARLGAADFVPDRSGTTLCHADGRLVRLSDHARSLLATQESRV